MASQTGIPRQEDNPTFSSSNHEKPSLPDDPLTSRVLDLLQRVLGPQKHDVWSSVAQSSQKTERKRKRIGVLDVSGSNDSGLIYSLTGTRNDDPAVRDAMDSRWVSLPESTGRLIIRNGEKVARFGSVLELPSEKLAKANVEVMEVRDVSHAPDLLRADLPVIFLSSGNQAKLPFLKRLENVNYVPISRKDVVISGAKAQDGLSKTSFDTLYDLMQGDRSSEDSKRRRSRLLRAMLDDCSAQLEASSQALEPLREQSRLLESEQAVLLDQLRLKFQSIDIPVELREIKTRLFHLINGFLWFRFWEVDEIGDEVQSHVVANYGVSLERKLEWLAGSMASTQERLNKLTNEYLAQVSRAVGSATLKNEVARIEEVTLPVPPSCFTAPIINRRRQLADIATPYMQSRFLRRVYSATMGMPVATGAPALLWANQLLDSSTAIPVGVLGFLLCVRQISQAWVKSRRKWTADYDRIQAGLESDISSAVKETLDQRVKAVSQAALEGSKVLIKQREEILAALAAEAKEAEEEVRRLS